jgi:putative transcriptional regulator
MSGRAIHARTKPGGTVWQMHPDGTETLMERTPIRPMTDEEIEAAALSDPDCPPMTEAELAAMRHVNLARRERYELRLTQEEFAVRYRIPLGTLRDWEQGRLKFFLHIINRYVKLIN